MTVSRHILYIYTKTIFTIDRTPVNLHIATTYTRNSLSARARPERLRDPRRRPDSNVPGHAQPRHEHDLYGITSQRRVACIFAAHTPALCRIHTPCSA